ncbi:MAG: hypothetical protein GY822_14445 [Deltaproteobacteria bacterium]|nr:hypothetical protein [Deltaproteobacteria bacterium]
MAAPRVEAWFLAAYVPRDETESAGLEKQRKQLSFDPITKANKLRSRQKGNARNPKTVVDALGGVERAAKGLSKTNWETIQSNDSYGLMKFIDELRAHVVSLFIGNAAS